MLITYDLYLTAYKLIKFVENRKQAQNLSWFILSYLHQQNLLTPTIFRDSKFQKIQVKKELIFETSSMKWIS